MIKLATLFQHRKQQENTLNLTYVTDVYFTRRGTDFDLLVFLLHAYALLELTRCISRKIGRRFLLYITHYTVYCPWKLKLYAYLDI